MKAIVFKSKEQGPRLAEVPIPCAGRGEVLVRLHYAALNHLDLWTWNEQTLSRPVISGSDGAGIVETAGSDVDANWIGKEVVINPGLYWGGNENIHSHRFEILGINSNGSFAGYVVVPKEYVYEKPSHLTLKEAASLPLAALTAYRILFTKARIKSSDKVLITGIGGGVALFVLQMALAAGADVYATSSSNEKIEKAIALGAKGGYNYKNVNWVGKAKEECGGFDLIVDSAGGNGFSNLVDVANAGARIVLIGRTAGIIHDLKPSIIYNKQLAISGSLMGSPKEFAAMLEFYSAHHLHPVIDREFDLVHINKAKEYMEEGKHFGKLILKIQ